MSKTTKSLLSSYGSQPSKMETQIPIWSRFILLHYVFDTKFIFYSNNIKKKPPLAKYVIFKGKLKVPKGGMQRLSGVAAVPQGPPGTPGPAARAHSLTLPPSCSATHSLTHSSHSLLHLGTTIRHTQATHLAWDRVGRWHSLPADLPGRTGDCGPFETENGLRNEIPRGRVHEDPM